MLNTLAAPRAQVTRSNSAVSLSDLTKVIRAEHAAILQAANDVLSHVLAAGRALIAAQKSVPKGQWADWVSGSCEVSYRSARRYMQLTHAYEASGHSVASDLVGQSLRRLMRALTPLKQSGTVRQRRGPWPATQENLVAWADASPVERARFISAIGWPSLAAVLPRDWLPVIEQWLQVHLPKEAAVTIDQNGCVLPDDLSIPAFLRRNKD